MKSSAGWWWGQRESDGGSESGWAGHTNPSPAPSTTYHYHKPTVRDKARLRLTSSNKKCSGSSEGVLSQEGATDFLSSEVVRVNSEEDCW